MRYAIAMIFCLFVGGIDASEFNSVDINTGIAGNTTENGASSFSITGSGGDIWNNEDGFRFVYVPMSGSFDVRARIASVDFTDAWSKAGLMIRQSTDSNSIHAMMVATAGNGTALQYRTNAGGWSSHIWAGSANFPDAWVRLIRVGNLVTALRSLDAAGSTWELVSTISLNLNDTVLVGMAVTAHNAGALCAAEFRDVTFLSYTPPVIGSGDGLRASYCNSMDMADYPILSRVDPQVNFDWGNGAPDASVNSDHFSVRWLGQVEAQFTEPYTFHVRGDDGVRLWVNGQLLVNAWWDQGPTEYSSTVSMAAGQKYDIRLEYFENGGGAVAELRWSSFSTPKQFIPQSQLYSTGNAMVIGTGDGLHGSYSNSMDISDPSALTRIDSRIDFDWNYSSPDAAINPDHFCALWLGQVQPQFTENYTFYIRADDGVRLWLNHQLVVEAWYDEGPTEYSVTLPLTAGQKYDIAIEFYEDGGGAVCQLQWSSPSTFKQFIPQSQLYSTGNALLIGTGDGLRGNYVNSMDPSGKTALSRIDPQVKFNWGGASPDPLLNADHFSVRWIGQVQAQLSEDYRFYLRGDDGVRLWVNRQLLIDGWRDQGATEYSSSLVPMLAGNKYDIVIEYYENAGDAVCELNWSSPSTPKRHIPQSQLYSTGNTEFGDGTGLLAQYFNSIDLSSPVAPFNVPVLTRVDGEVNFDWGNGSPDEDIQSDSFSVRWIGQIQAQYDEPYTFHVTADDGIRLWINNRLLIDQWKDQAPTTYSATINMKAGEKVGIKMEYYERGGGAVAKLEWSSPSRPRVAVPATQMYSNSGLAVPIPTYSVTSPAFIEGIAWSPNDAPVSVSANGATSTFITDNNWYANVPLRADGQVTEVTVSQSGTGASQAQSVIWWPLDLAGDDDSAHNIVIRKGDALLLTANGTGESLSLDIDSDGLVDFSGIPGQTFPVSYLAAGTFLAEAKIDDISVGTLLVTVMDADLHKPIAGELGFQRRKNVVVTPATSAGNVILGAADSTSLWTSVVGPFNNTDGEGTALDLKALKRGMPVLVARIGNGSGPILVTRTIDEFSNSIPNRREFMSNAETGLAHLTLTMRPFVPNLDYHFTIFASQCTFEDGSQALNVSSSIFDQVFDPESNETIGLFTYKVAVPTNENKACIHVSISQISSEPQEVGREDGINPKICKATCDQVKMCTGDKGVFAKIKVVQFADVPGADPTVAIYGGSGLHWTTEDPAISCKDGHVTGSLELSADGGGHYELTLGSAHFPDCVIVVGVTVDADKSKVCVGDKVTFTADGQLPGGTYSWSAPGGSPSSGGNNSTFKTKYTSPGKKTVTVTYTQDGITCKATKEITVKKLSLNPSEIAICVDETSAPITATVEPSENGDGATLKQESTQGAVDFSKTILDLSSGSDTFTVKGLTAGKVTVTATLNNPKCKAKLKVHVLEEGEIAIIPDEAAICEGDTQSFTAWICKDGKAQPDNDAEWTVDAPLQIIGTNKGSTIKVLGAAATPNPEANVHASDNGSSASASLTVVKITASPTTIPQLCIGGSKDITVTSIPDDRSIVVEYDDGNDAPFDLSGVESLDTISSGDVLTANGKKCGSGTIKLYDEELGEVCGVSVSITVVAFEVEPQNGFPHLCVSPEEQYALKIKKCDDPDAASQARIYWAPEDGDAFDVYINGELASSGDVHDLDADISILAKKCIDQATITIIPVDADGNDDESCLRTESFSIKTFKVGSLPEPIICVLEEEEFQISKCDDLSPDQEVKVIYDSSIITITKDGGTVASGATVSLNQESISLKIKGVDMGHAAIKLQTVPHDPECEVTLELDVTGVSVLYATIQKTGEQDASGDAQPADPKLVVCADDNVEFDIDWFNDIDRGSEHARFKVEGGGANPANGNFSGKPIPIRFETGGEKTITAWCDGNKNGNPDPEEHPIRIKILVLELKSLKVSEKSNPGNSVAGTKRNPPTLKICEPCKDNVFAHILVEGTSEPANPNLPQELRRYRVTPKSPAADPDDDSLNGVKDVKLDGRTVANHKYLVEAGIDCNKDGKLDDDEVRFSVNVLLIQIDTLTITDGMNPTNKVTLNTMDPPAVPELFVCEKNFTTTADGSAEIKISATSRPTNELKRIRYLVNGQLATPDTMTLDSERSVILKPGPAPAKNRVYEIQAGCDLNGNNTLDPDEVCRTIKVTMIRVEIYNRTAAIDSSTAEVAVMDEYKANVLPTPPIPGVTLKYQWKIDGSDKPPLSVALKTYEHTMVDSNGVGFTHVPVELKGAYLQAPDLTLETDLTKPIRTGFFWTDAGTRKLKLEVEVTSASGKVTCDREITVVVAKDPDMNNTIYSRFATVTIPWGPGATRTFTGAGAPDRRHNPNGEREFFNVTDDHGRWHHGPKNVAGEPEYDHDMGSVDYEGERFFKWHEGIINLHEDWRKTFHDTTTFNITLGPALPIYFTAGGGAPRSEVWGFVRLDEYDDLEQLGQDIHPWHNEGHNDFATLPDIINSFTNLGAKKNMFWNWHRQIDAFRKTVPMPAAPADLASSIPTNDVTAIIPSGGTTIEFTFTKPVSSGPTDINKAPMTIVPNPAQTRPEHLELTMPGGKIITATPPGAPPGAPPLITRSASADNKTHTFTVPAMKKGGVWQAKLQGTARGYKAQTIKFKIKGAAIVVTPSSLDFGNQGVGAGATAAGTITISNDATATENLNISSVTMAGADFNKVTDTGNAVLAPGASRTITITFDPTTVGAKTGTLSIVSDDAEDGTVSVPLTGMGIP